MQLTLFPFILGIESENQVEEETIKNSPGQQYGDIVPDVLHFNVHGEENIFTDQYTAAQFFGIVMQFADL